MSPPSEPAETLTPAERRLLEHLEIVKAEPPAPGPPLARKIVRVARRQRALREPLRLVGTIAGSVIDGLAGLLGIRRGRRS